MKAIVANMPKHWQEERKNSDSAQWDEMWNGVLHMPPMPSIFHQDFEGKLYAYLLYEWARPRGFQVFKQINLTTADETDWTRNYRVPDILLLTPDRFSIMKDSHMAGAPLVVVEIRSPDDETYDKLPFYAALGVPEVWVFDRDTKAVELRSLTGGPAYTLLAPGPDGWHRSPASGVEFRQTSPGKVRARVNGDDSRAEELPN